MRNTSRCSDGVDSIEEAPTWKEGEVANTLNTFDAGEQRCNELAVKAYGVCSKASHAMLSDNPHSGFYEAQTWDIMKTARRHLFLMRKSGRN